MKERLKEFEKRHPFLYIFYFCLLGSSAFYLLAFSYYLIFESRLFINAYAFLFCFILMYLVAGSNYFVEYKFLKREADKATLNLGLRKIYKKNKRLPKFICKNCLKTIIVKNIDIVCPFCDAEFRVTDDDKSKQIGDVFAKGVRNIVNESTMERILFVGCPACGGKMQHIDCYHCNKEIDIFEEYDELKLERKRYE